LRNNAEVEYVLHNRYQARQENFDAVRELAQEERFGELVKRYRDELQ
jgi:hypothetical protein